MSPIGVGTLWKLRQCCWSGSVGPVSFPRIWIQQESLKTENKVQHKAEILFLHSKFIWLLEKSDSLVM